MEILRDEELRLSLNQLAFYWYKAKLSRPRTPSLLILDSLKITMPKFVAQLGQYAPQFLGFAAENVPSATVSEPSYNTAFATLAN